MGASLLMDIEFEERNVDVATSADGTTRQTLQTMMRVVVRPRRKRDRRRNEATERARQLVASLKSYLMANAVGSEVDTRR